MRSSIPTNTPIGIWLVALALFAGQTHVTALTPFRTHTNNHVAQHGLSSPHHPSYRRIPRGGTAKSIPPPPPPADEEAAASAARAAATTLEEDRQMLEQAHVPQPGSDEAAIGTNSSSGGGGMEAAQAPPPTADHTRNLSSKLSNAWERTVPALLMLGAATLLLKFAGSTGLMGLIFLLQIGMYHETTSIIEAFHLRSDPGSIELKKENQLLDTVEKWWWFVTVWMGTSVRSLLLGMDNSNIMSETVDMICYAMVAVGLLGAVVGMEVHSRSGPEMFRNYLGGLAGCHFVLIFLIGQSSFWIKTVQEYGMAWVLYPALLVIVNDTMAYVFGLTMGKHKLLPSLSPKKTWEGFAGALLSTVGIAVPLLKWVVGTGGSEAGTDNAVNMTRLALTLGLFISLVSPFGGFLASAVKRAHGAKDFGTLIPGHGGVVDRFDCQIVTAPFVFLLLKYFGVGGAAAAADAM